VLATDSNLDIGPVPVGTTSPALTLTLTRTIDACHEGMALGPFTISLSNADLVVTRETCSSSVLVEGETCTLSLAARPKAAGYHSGTVMVASPSYVTANQTLYWTGVATDAGIAASPDSAALDAGGEGHGETGPVPICGDGIVSGAEECDDGKNDADYGATTGCAPNCKPPPRCGDGIVQADYGEACDFGRENSKSSDPNVTWYGCTATCQRGGFCGDGIVNGPEECDDGANDGSYGTCDPDCTIPPSCGDAILQPAYGEECEPQGPDDPDCLPTCRCLSGKCV
jgi:hypothetical protein